MKKIQLWLVALMMVGTLVVAPLVQAQTTSLEDTLKQIQALMAQVEALQKQLATLRGEVRDIIRQNLAEGMSGDDIKKIQELLASDPSIYPEGMVTGFYGPLTREAVKRLQARHQMVPTGQIDDETRLLLESYLEERFGETIPPGLLRAPGIAKKVEDRVASNCSAPGRGLGPLCKRVKENKTDDNPKPETGPKVDEVKVTVSGATTTVSFRYAGVNYTVTILSTNEATVLAAVADRLNKTVVTLPSDLVKKIKERLAKALADLVSEAERAAMRAIDKAEDAIADAEEAIEEANGDTTNATTKLNTAKQKLAAAKRAYSAKNYASAKALAEEAEALAETAKDLVGDGNDD